MASYSTQPRDMLRRVSPSSQLRAEPFEVRVHRLIPAAGAGAREPTDAPDLHLAVVRDVVLWDAIPGAQPDLFEAPLGHGWQIHLRWPDAGGSELPHVAGTGICRPFICDCIARVCG